MSKSITRGKKREREKGNGDIYKERKRKKCINREINNTKDEYKRIHPHIYSQGNILPSRRKSNKKAHTKYKTRKKISHKKKSKKKKIQTKIRRRDREREKEKSKIKRQKYTKM